MQNPSNDLPILRADQMKMLKHLTKMQDWVEGDDALETAAFKAYEDVLYGWGR